MGKHDIVLEQCGRGNLLYQEIRDRHYIPNNGAVGQQIHYLIIVDGKCVGIISGGSSAYAVKPRDDFFGITSGNRRVSLNGIVDNTVFRLEMNEPNLGTQILSKWRKQIEIDWYNKYDVEVAGFETFVIENERRKGSLYKADNWTYVGTTQGSTKFHMHGIENKFIRQKVEQKLIFCKWVKNGKLPTEYIPTWNLHGQIKGQMTFDDLFSEDTKKEGVK